MDSLTEQERKALDIMKKDNFRGISKENVMQFISILDKVDPEVAKEIIAQYPEVARLVSEAEKGYAEVLSKGIDSASASAQACFDSEDEIIKSAQKELDKENVPFEEKKYYFERMEEAAKRKESKDTENKSTLMSILKMGGQVVLGGCLIAVGVLAGRSDFKLPSGKA